MYVYIYIYIHICVYTHIYVYILNYVYIYRMPAVHWISHKDGARAILDGTRTEVTTGHRVRVGGRKLVASPQATLQMGI